MSLCSGLPTQAAVSLHRAVSSLTAALRHVARGVFACAVHSGTLKRGESEEVDRLLDEYAPDTNEITFEQYKRGVRKAIKRYKKENSMSARGKGADHLGR